jgi:hypothetical protein
MSELAYPEQEENTGLHSLERIYGSALLEETEQSDGTTGEIRLTRRGGVADTISGGRIVPTTRGEID